MFAAVEFKFGIDCSNKSLDEIIIQIKTFLKILESAKFIVYNQRRELSKNYFNDYPLFVQNSLNVFDKYSISLYYTGIKNILSELNKLKDDNEQMKLRITDLLKDKEFLMNQLQKTFK